VVVVCLLLIVRLCGAHPLSLPRAQELLFDNNHQLQICDLRQRRADLRIVTARAAWFPTASLFAGYHSQSERSRISFSGTVPLSDSVAVPLRIDKGLSDYDRVEGGVEVSWPAFLGLSRNHRIRAAEIDKRLVDLEYESLRNRLSLELGLLYFRWQLAHDNVRVHETLIRQMSEYTARVTELHESGMQARSKVLEASAKLEAAKVELVQTRHTIDSLKLEIADFLKLSDTAVTPAPYTEQTLTARMPRADSAGITRRPEIASCDLRRRRLHHTRRALLGRRLPAVFIGADYRYANPGLYLGKDEYMGYATLGLTARWDFYDGLENWSRRKVVEYDRSITDKQRERHLDTWTKRASLARMQLESAHRMQAAAELSLEASRALEEDLRNALGAGVIVSAEYLNAVTALARAEFALAKAKTLKKSALLRLRFALGEEIAF
jgi:outer membrane protein TolC